MNILGKSLIAIGMLIALIGAGILIFSRFKIPFLGRLPGDILIQKKNFTFYFPIATSILASVILSLVLYVISKIHR
ncbi:MAG: DUF2905 domain-containing protein [Candidatus Omnitrophica bacterium]|nr:DUF2905 domain-containing protein [Candidatus Omnitrophota bacterium]